MLLLLDSCPIAQRSRPGCADSGCADWLTPARGLGPLLAPARPALRDQRCGISAAGSALWDQRCGISAVGSARIFDEDWTKIHPFFCQDPLFFLSKSSQNPLIFSGEFTNFSDRIHYFFDAISLICWGARPAKSTNFLTKMGRKFTNFFVEIH